jgi:hypothetical protein
MPALESLMCFPFSTRSSGMSERLYVLVAFAFLTVFHVSANCADKGKENKIPDGARVILEKAEQIELLSLDPTPPKEKLKDAFHGWNVLGKTVVKDAETCKKLVATLKKGVEENDGRVAKCFNPRHGIRAVYDGKTADFVICFECLQGHTYLGDKEVEAFLITDSPAAGFDKVLKDAKVPLPEKPKNK